MARERSDWQPKSPAAAAAGAGPALASRNRGYSTHRQIFPDCPAGSRAYVKGEYRYSNYEAGAWKQQGLVGVGLRF